MSRWWYGVAAATGVQFVFVFWSYLPVGFTFEAAIGGGALSAILSASWLGMPVALYMDRRTIRDDTDWQPATWRWLVLSFVWLANIPVGLAYCLRRFSAVKNEAPSEKWEYVVYALYGLLVLVTILSVSMMDSKPVTGLLWLTSVLFAVALYLDIERARMVLDVNVRKGLLVAIAIVVGFNLLVGLYYIATRAVQTNDADHPRMTRSLGFIMGTALFYSSSLAIEVVPYSGVKALIALGVVVFWVGFPVALHYDRKYITRHTDWRPSRWYYLGTLPGYLGVVFVLHYLSKRMEFRTEKASVRDESSS